MAIIENATRAWDMAFYQKCGIVTFTLGEQDPQKVRHKLAWGEGDNSDGK